MVIFHSYVSLPEGTSIASRALSFARLPGSLPAAVAKMARQAAGFQLATKRLGAMDIAVVQPHMGGFIHGCTPIAGWFVMGNPIKMDDDWGYHHDLGNLHLFCGTKEHVR